MLQTITTRIHVQPGGQVVLPNLPAIQPGEYEAVLVIEAVSETGHAAPALPQIPVVDVGPWPADLSLRREDLYGDEGR